MPALLPGFEYDIFISYRQKDNKGDHWVTKFVNALKTELEATFKEDISIYFDQNPRDGLLETHQVHKSLESKLKCLIFIPVISQTYCDPKSYAWQHEFCAFNKLAQEDQFGRDIKLSNGNIASRILPIKIHDLDADDQSTINLELGGELRSIEFIYKEPGVNRPLKELDNKADNQNKIDYQNQINKTAKAIKEIIAGLKNFTKITAQPDKLDLPKIKAQDTQSSSPKTYVQFLRTNKKTIFISSALLLVFALLFALFQYLKPAGQNQQTLDKTIAVLPFEDMTPGKDMEYLGDGIAEEIINSLTTIQELKVIGRTSSFQFKGEKIDLRVIGKKLRVGIVLEGSIQKFEDNYRITAQLVRTNDNVHVWSQRFDLQQMNIFKIQDNIASAIVQKLQLTLSASEEQKIHKEEINEEAYNLFLKGLFKYKAENYQECIDLELRAIGIDSTYAPAYAYIGLSKAWITFHAGKVDSTLLREAEEYSQRSIELDPNLAEGYSALALISWRLKWDVKNANHNFEKSIQLNPSSSLNKNRYAYFLTWMGDFEKASRMAADAIRLDPADFNSYVILFNTAIYQNNLDQAMTHLDEYRLLFGDYAFNKNKTEGVDRFLINSQLRLNYYRGNYPSVIKQLDSLSNTGLSLSAMQWSFLARSHDQLKHPGASETILNKLKEMVIKGVPQSSYETALVYALRTETDSCFYYLNISLQRKESNLVFLKIQPEFKNLHQDPRYIAIYRQVGFDQY